MFNKLVCFLYVTSVSFLDIYECSYRTVEPIAADELGLQFSRAYLPLFVFAVMSSINFYSGPSFFPLFPQAASFWALGYGLVRRRRQIIQELYKSNTSTGDFEARWTTTSTDGALPGPENPVL